MMEGKLKSSTPNTVGLKNAIDRPVICSENLFEDNNRHKMEEERDVLNIGCIVAKSKTGVNLHSENNDAVICQEKANIATRLRRSFLPPPTELIGDDGTKILVKDVSVKNTNSMNVSSPNHHVTKDKDSDSGIGCIGIEKTQSWLLRLFESKLFDASMAISYMFHSKERGVLGYIGNRLFTYPDSDVDFYLPQLVSMYIMSHEVAEVIHPYMVYRCRNSVDFSLRCAWLLEAYVACDKATSGNKKKVQHGIKLKNLILSGDLVPKAKGAEKDKLQKPKKTIYTHSQVSTSGSDSQRRPTGHVRSRSDASGLLNCDQGKNAMKPFTTATFLPDHATAATVGANNYCNNTTATRGNLITPLMGGGVGGARYTHQPFYPHPKYNALLQHNSNGRNHPNSLSSTPAKPKLSLGDLTSGRAFDNGCICFESCKAAVNDLCGRKTFCTCGAPRLAPQQEFIRALLSIGKRLGALQVHGGNGTVSQNKDAKTQRLLAELSMLNLNLPARVWVPIHSNVHHLVVRVPAQAATVLNSKDRAPYIIYVECLEVEDVAACPVPQKIVNSAIACASQRNNLQDANNGERNGRNIETKHLRSKSEERLVDRLSNLDSHATCQEAASSGCGTGSTSTGDSTSSSSPGAPSAIQTQNTKDEVNDTINSDPQEPSEDNGRVLFLENSASTISLPVMMLPNFQTPGSVAGSGAGSGGFPDIDCWSQEDDELTMQYPEFRSLNSIGYGGSKSSSLSRRDAAFPAPDTISMMSIESTDSSRTGGFSATQSEPPMFIAAGDIRRRLSESLKEPKGFKNFRRDPDDPSASVLKEPWEAKVSRIKQSSPYGHLPNWKLIACIVKCGDDLRQELLAYQILETLQSIWKEEKVPLWVRPYRILVLSNDSGLIEPILNTISLHQVKKHGHQHVKLASDFSGNSENIKSEAPSSNESQTVDSSPFTLLKYFLHEFGPATSEQFMEAQKNFVQSCAAYCIVSYLIQVKDRHNGNILLDNEGHLIHIDYGFILSASPKNLGFESSPFKLTPEFVDVMGGQGSDMFEYFKLLILQGLIAARKHSDRILSIVDIMRAGSQLPCFTSGSAASAQAMKARFHMNLTEEQLLALVNTLVDQSINSLTTKLYDGFQYYSNGIL